MPRAKQSTETKILLLFATLDEKDREGCMSLLLAMHQTLKAQQLTAGRQPEPEPELEHR